MVILDKFAEVSKILITKNCDASIRHPMLIIIATSEIIVNNQYKLLFIVSYIGFKAKRMKTIGELY